MQTGQVSVWVPIVVGIIGLLGVVAGQLVNAWREDRRWKREQQREEIRWERERDKECARLAHDSMIDWRDRRLIIYGDFLQSLFDIIETVNNLSWSNTIDEARMHASKWAEYARITHRLSQNVRLAGTRSIWDALNDETFTVHFSLAPAPFTTGRTSSEELEHAKHTAANMINEMQRYYRKVVELMRVELQADPPMSKQM